MIILTDAQHAELTERLIRMARGRFVNGSGNLQPVSKYEMVSEARRACEALGIHYGRDAKHRNAIKWDMAQEVRRVLAAIERDGTMRVVPTVSTPAMREAGARAAHDVGFLYENIWRAMLAAAPKGETP